MLIRSLDIFISFSVLSVFFPFYIIICIAILIDSGFPIHFVQKRVGRNEELFNFIKFRTMKYDPSIRIINQESESYKSIPISDLKKKRLNYKTTTLGDNRINLVGSLLRKTSIDEVPQFFNVIMGDMSIVGPRPSPPVERVDFPEKIWIKRCSVKPGITGLAQVNGRSNITMEEKIKYEMEWVSNTSIFTYLKVLLSTPFTLVKNNN